ncbi:MAG: glycosyltransferase [Bacteroidia bacterium]|nr:glycosyltransferase [Bacteroidia bacterium]
MKLLILTSRFPYPIEKGDKLRIYHQIRHLSQKHEVHLIAISDQEVEEAHQQHLESFCSSIHIFPISKGGIAFSLLKGLFGVAPFQVHYFYRKRIHKKILKIAEELKPDRIYCQLIRMAPYVKGLDAQKSLDYMDAFSLGMKRRAKHHVGIKQVLFRWEASKLKSYEEKVFTDFNSHSIISEQDREALNTPYKDQIQLIPNGVDTEFFQPKKEEAEYDLVFVGNLGYSPNILAAKYLATQLLPRIRKDLPETRLLLAGARPVKQILELEKEAGVSIGGWYEDIRDAYASGKIFVAPLFSGSGQQNKILEAMAMGIPCVSTSIVNKSIGAKSPRDILLGDDLESLAEHCIFLLKNPDHILIQASHGRAFVENNYAWSRSHKQLDELFSRSVSLTR